MRFDVRYAAVAATCLLLSACSTKQWYEGGRAGVAEECRRLPSEAQYQRCMEDARLSYEDYQRRREGSDTPESMRR
ncbi:hypothetical protein [Pseudomarimonas salicorniae]|uniref:Lipoprotein n=1 Tax=Pseudomarimonas salicorniae TaxID=2933270 RepID=A0ABT0GER6_9GAMM|nr:hypothetical protein [Lysobacter sp. CAU 1642]MCK7593044.1 hypothetical protein [Lysobacter sp. CAU 1642]